MSAGKFLANGKYESDEGDIFRIRIQPETVTAINTLPDGEVSGTGSVRVGGGNRQIGIKARSITVRWAAAAADPNAAPGTPAPTAPDPPAGYDPGTLLRVPILRASVYAGISLGSTFAYLGKRATVVGKNPERVR